MSQASTISPVGEVVEFFAQGPSREEIAGFRLSDQSQQRLRDLIHKNSADELAPFEQRELDEMLLLDDIVSLIRARVQRHALPGAEIVEPSDA